jgi:RNA polymerase sigma-70 factor (ECF subfamily)
MPEGADNQDQEDVRQVLAGKAEAFAGIVGRWQRPIVNLAFRFCRNRAQAEEMAQDAFLRAYRALGQWRGDAAFSTWLFAVSINVFRSHMRRVQPVEVPLEEVRPSMTGHGIQSQHALIDTDDVVRRTVATLPPKYRDAMIAFYFMEQDLSQAARSLGVPDGTMKARLHRGRELLKRRLARVLGREVEEAKS